MVTLAVIMEFGPDRQLTILFSRIKCTKYQSIGTVLP